MDLESRLREGYKKAYENRRKAPPMSLGDSRALDPLPEHVAEAIRTLEECFNLAMSELLICRDEFKHAAMLHEIGNMGFQSAQFKAHRIQRTLDAIHRKRFMTELVNKHATY
jgi:hypothetical protein